jgi:hypothetical protein
MTYSIHDDEREARNCGVAVPMWIEQDITIQTVAAIQQGKCESGAYMPAVTYRAAAETMSEHGDSVLQYIEDVLGELPLLPQDTSWRGIACHFLACAVDLWADLTAEKLQAGGERIVELVENGGQR